MARTAYHIRALHARGLIEEIRPRLSRGARQREYSLTGDGRHVLQLATKLLG
jgi:DNA-binding MarR family transcriptional regulator